MDFPTPEDLVSEFYEAYFVHDYELAAQNISVFWAASSCLNMLKKTFATAEGTPDSGKGNRQVLCSG